MNDEPIHHAAVGAVEEDEGGVDLDLATLRELWVAEPPAPALDFVALRRRAHRRSLGLRLAAVVEVLFALAGTAWLLDLARSSGRGVDVLLLAGFVLLVGSALAFTWWNRRGVWSAAGETAADFLRLSRERCRRRRRSVHFGFGLLAAEALLLGGWGWARVGAPFVAGGTFYWSLLAVVLLAFLGVLVALELYSRREDRQLAALARELGDETPI